MRALKVLGIAENGTQVVCQPVPEEDGARGPTGKPVTPVETFTLAVDERLRAAVRGDLSRIGQLEIEMESQLRPKEIQQRIRAGSTVEQVAAAAGCSPDRIERYAYPVLLERSTIAERARRAHPVVDGVAAARTVEHLAADSLAGRGQQVPITWDAFRDERGWALRASWKAGRSENRATWSYHAGPAGGTVIARDEGAAMLVDPAPRPLRTVSTGTPVSSPTRAPHPVEAAAHRAVPAAPTLDSDDHRMPGDEVTERADAPDHDLDEQRRLVADTVIDARSGSRQGPAGDPTGASADTVVRADEVGRARDTGTDGPAAPHGATAPPGVVSGASATARGKRGQRPQMPSWEDVLLGTRTGR